MIPQRGRRRLLLLPIVAALLLVSLKLVSMSWFSSQGAEAYDDERYRHSHSAFDSLRLLNLIEPWRAHFGLGTALYRQGDLEGAQAEFTRALELAPERCEVRFNLAVTIEAQGDQRVGGPTRDVEESERQDGFARYRVALDIANGRSCPATDPEGIGERLGETRERLRNKLGGEASEDGEEIEPPGELEDEPEDAEESSSDQEELERRNQNGAGEREDHSDLDATQIQPPNESNW